MMKQIRSTSQKEQSRQYQNFHQSLYQLCKFLLHNYNIKICIKIPERKINATLSAESAIINKKTKTKILLTLNSRQHKYVRSTNLITLQVFTSKNCSLVNESSCFFSKNVWLLFRVTIVHNYGSVRVTVSNHELSDT